MVDPIVSAPEADFILDRSGVYVPRKPVGHREEEYDPADFDMLRDMQARHFWYLGRHRFLLRALDDLRLPGRGIRAVDLGGGCGGWLAYLRSHLSGVFAELALADSSLRGLEMAAAVVSPECNRYQIDLMDLPWRDHWDVAFLLDVLEHIPDDSQALRQIWQTLRPGGLLFVTTPALMRFWSHNDDMVHHVRRYSRSDFSRLATQAGYEVVTTRYFMFFLSPLLLASRLKRVNPANMSREQVRSHLRRTHRVPAAPINQLLRLVFSLETPLGHWVPLPWGSSVLGVFRKPLAGGRHE